jgi:HlyD family secretion protein
VKKKIIWIGIILVLASLVVIKLIMGSPGVTVETRKVMRGSIEEYIEETGNILLEEEKIIYSVSSGRVVKVVKKPGEVVKAGEMLVEIDNSDLLLQKKILEMQKLAIASKYAEAKTLTDDENIRKLNAQVRSAEALYEEAERTRDNSKILYEAGAISLNEYNNSITSMSVAEASLETAKSNLAMAEKGISVNVRKQYEAQLSEIQARINQLKVNTEDMVVKAPIDGIILDVEAEEGGMVQAGAKLCSIGGYKGYFIESDVLIEDIVGVKIGASVIIEAEDIGISDMKGTVRKIYPKAFNKMSTLGIEQKRVKVEIDFDNKIEDLRPGYDMTVKIITDSKKDTLLIPEKAVFNYQGKDHVFINEGGTARLRVIEKGLESNEQVEVLKGIEEGEEVILSPDEAMEEGTKIEPEEA